MTNEIKETKETKETTTETFDSLYSVEVCPYCNHSKTVDVKQGGFFSFKFDTHKCSNCSREFRFKKSLWVCPRDEVTKIIQHGIDGKLSKKQLKEKLEKIGVYVYLPYKSKFDKKK